MEDWYHCCYWAVNRQSKYSSQQEITGISVLVILQLAMVDLCTLAKYVDGSGFDTVTIETSIYSPVA